MDSNRCQLWGQTSLLSSSCILGLVENFQGQRLRSPCGQPMPVPCHLLHPSLYPWGEKVSPTCSLNFFWFNVCLFSPALLSGTAVKSLLTVSLQKAAGRSPWSCLSPGRTSLAPSASPRRSGAPEHLAAPLLNLLRFVDVFPVVGSEIECSTLGCIFERSSLITAIIL